MLNLTKEQELTLFYNKNYNKLLEYNLSNIRDIATWLDYSPGQQHVGDLISLGAITFLKKIKDYDPDKGTRVSTYVFPYIKGEMLLYLRETRYYQHDNPDNIPDDTTDPMKQMDITLLHERVDALPDRHAFVINSLFFNNLSRTEVADILKVNPSRVSQIKHEAFRMLREVL